MNDSGSHTVLYYCTILLYYMLYYMTIYCGCTILLYYITVLMDLCDRKGAVRETLPSIISVPVVVKEALTSGIVRCY